MKPAAELKFAKEQLSKGYSRAALESLENVMKDWKRLTPKQKTELIELVEVLEREHDKARVREGKSDS